MDPNVLIQNDLLFGNILLELIPHPVGKLGTVLNFLTIFCHYLAGIPVFIILLPILYFFYNQRFGIQMAMAILSTGILNGLLKYYSASPRPIGLSVVFLDIQQFVKESSFGFPSGHSHVSVLMWGLVFYEFKNIWIRIVAIFFILFTPFSRMYAGVHYPGDVLGGVLSGVITLFFLIWFFKKYPSFPDILSWKNPSKMALSSSLAVAVIGISTILIEKPGDSLPHIHSLEQVVSAAGSMVGMWIGIILWRLKHSKDEFNELQIFPVILFFTLSILFFYFGLSYLSKWMNWNGVLFRFVKYAILNFSIMFLVPYLSFRLMGEKIKLN